jgi:hypothetical protein
VDLLVVPGPPAEDSVPTPPGRNNEGNQGEVEEQVLEHAHRRPREEQQLDIIPNPPHAVQERPMMPHGGRFHRLRQRLVRFQLAEVDRYQEHTPRRQTTDTVPVVSLRQKTAFFGFLLVLCQFALVDNYHLLPVGMILYAMGIGCLVELLETYDGDDEVEIFFPWPESSPLQQQLEDESRLKNMEQRNDGIQQHHHQQQDWKEKEIRQLQNLVDFEFRVLQGQERAPRVVAREEYGNLVYYTL